MWQNSKRNRGRTFEWSQTSEWWSMLWNLRVELLENEIRERKKKKNLFVKPKLREERENGR